MTLFMIERNFAETLSADADPEEDKLIDAVSTEMGLEWLHTFLSADGKRTYCLYEAPNADALREHASRLGLPADTIVEVSQYR